MKNQWYKWSDHPEKNRGWYWCWIKSIPYIVYIANFSASDEIVWAIDRIPNGCEEIIDDMYFLGPLKYPDIPSIERQKELINNGINVWKA